MDVEKKERMDVIEKEIENEKKEKMDQIEKEKKERMEEKNKLENKNEKQTKKVHNLEEKEKKNKNLSKKWETKEEEYINDIDKLKLKIKNREKSNKNPQKEIKSLYKNLKEFHALNNIKKEQDEFIKNLEKTIGNIQFRYYSKNFLKFFKRYLTSEDIKIIEDDPYKKGEIILKRYKATFAANKNTKTYNLIKTLILKAIKLLNSGNSNAHNILLNKYKSQIAEYKEKNKLLYIYFPLTFLYCINLNLADSELKNSYDFFQKYFDVNLIFDNSKIKEFEFEMKQK